MTLQDMDVQLSSNAGVLTKALRCAAIIFTLLTAAPAVLFGQPLGPVAVRVTPEVFAEVEDIQTIHTIDYGSFIWLELTPENFEDLLARGVEFEEQPPHTILNFQGIIIDTATEEPVPISEAGMHVVQMIGPVKGEELINLELLGLEILQYYPPFAYIVRATEMVPDIVPLDFVRWVGPYLPEYRIATDLSQRSEEVDIIENVGVTLYDSDRTQEITGAIAALGGELVEQEEEHAGDPFRTATFALPASALSAVAELQDVAWLNFRAPVDELEDEMSDQIIAGNFNPLNPGYQVWLTDKKVNGTDVTVALIDTGYDTGVDATSHQDVRGRLIPAGMPTDTNGHGTHVGGIIVGNANMGTMDGGNFLLGLGVAPAANMVVRSNLMIESDFARQRDAVTNGAVASNNSYSVNPSSGSGYTNRDRSLDALVRDADRTRGTTVAEPLIIVFSAGNCGLCPGPTAVCQACPCGGGTTGPGMFTGNPGPTKEAKNIIAVGNSLNQRFVATAASPGAVDTTQDIDNLRGSSSRGPAGDGRVYPHVTAPGTAIISTRSTQTMLTTCATIAAGAGAPAPTPMNMNPTTYSVCSGTSMAAPHVTGAVALITEWWRDLNCDADPSPAMAKALLVNGAVDMGTADIPNGNEGWGRINLSNVIDTGVPTVYVDQKRVFHNTGETWTDPPGTIVSGFAATDLSRPLKVTFAWSDAPGPGNGGNPCALVNDLDLVVTDPAGMTFRGNDFENGFSKIGGTANADRVDNLENVFIQNPVGGSYDITITAAGICGNGVPYNDDRTDQDFALVCSNCRFRTVCDFFPSALCHVTSLDDLLPNKILVGPFKNSFELPDRFRSEVFCDLIRDNCQVKYPCPPCPFPCDGRYNFFFDFADVGLDPEVLTIKFFNFEGDQLADEVIVDGSKVISFQPSSFQEGGVGEDLFFTFELGPSGEPGTRYEVPTRIEVVDGTGLIKPGDANQDGALDISDPKVILDFFFKSTGPVVSNLCFATPTGGVPAFQLTPVGLTILDWNGDGELDIADPIGQLTWEFQITAPHVLCTDLSCTNCILVVSPDCIDTCTP